MVPRHSPPLHPIDANYILPTSLVKLAASYTVIHAQRDIYLDTKLGKMLKHQINHSLYSMWYIPMWYLVQLS